MRRVDSFGKVFLCVAGGLLAVCASAWAIIVCDDPNTIYSPSLPDGHFVANTATVGSVTDRTDFSHDLAMVGYFYIGGMKASATVIAPEYILLAGHEVTSTNYTSGTFKIDGQSYTPIAYAEHSTADLAILRLNRSTRLPGYRLYTASSDTGKNVLLLGCGISGVSVADATNYPKGILRKGENRTATTPTTVVTDWAPSTTCLWMDFDDPAYTNADSRATLGAAREVGIADGDSGGATLLDVSGKYYLVGIHMTLIDFVSTVGEYAMADVRVRDYASWITTTPLTDGTCAPAKLPGDTNDDRRVDMTDMNTLGANIGMTSGATWAMGDFNGDGAVDDADQVILGRNFNVGVWPTEITPYLPGLPGDANTDGRVDAADVAMLRLKFGMTAGATWTDGDFDLDGDVDYLDQRAMGANYHVGIWTASHRNAMPGDANVDGQVDDTDFGALAVNFGTTAGATWAMGDFDGDGDVDAIDYATFADNYGWGVQDLSQVSDLPDCPGTGRISGTVVLEHFQGDITAVPVRIKLIQDGQVVRDVTVTLDSTGGFVLRNVPGGTYDVWVKAARWLSVQKTGIVVTPVYPGSPV